MHAVTLLECESAVSKLSSLILATTLYFNDLSTDTIVHIHVELHQSSRQRVAPYPFIVAEVITYGDGDTRIRIGGDIGIYISVLTILVYLSCLKLVKNRDMAVDSR